MSARTLALAGALLAAPGCFFWPANVDPAYQPEGSRALRAAGVHRLTYAVAVEDARGTADPRDLGTRLGTLLGRPRVRAARDAATIVVEALERELGARDLRVVRRGDAQVWLDVKLDRFYVRGAGSDPFGGIEGGEARAYAEGIVRVIDPANGESKLAVPIAARAVHRSMLLTARKYEWALADVAGEFARRAVRHPDVLIAIQQVGDVE